MKKKLFPLIASLLAIPFLVGCGPTEDPGDNPGEDPGEVSNVVVSFAEDSVIIKVDEEKIVTATVSGATDTVVTYSSSDTSVCTVNTLTGKLTGKAEGTAVITATSNEDNTKTDTITVTVSGYVAKITGISANPTSLSVFEDGGAANVVATVAGRGDFDAEVIYSVEDESVAEVSVAGGVATVTGKVTGTTKLICKAHGDESIKVEVPVTVAARVNPDDFDAITEIKLNVNGTVDTEAELYVNETATLNKRVKPSKSASASEYVIVSGSEFISLSGDTVTALAVGTAVIKAKSSQTGNTVESEEVTITVKEMPKFEVSGKFVANVESYHDTLGYFEGDMVFEVSEDKSSVTVTWNSVSHTYTIQGMDDKYGEDGYFYMVEADTENTAVIKYKKSYDNSEKLEVYMTATFGDYTVELGNTHTNEPAEFGKYIAVTKVAISDTCKGKFNAFYVGDKVELYSSYVTITPAGAYNKNVTWTSSDETVFKIITTSTTFDVGEEEETVTYPTVKAMGAGTAKLTATSNDNPSVKDEFEVTVLEKVYITAISLGEDFSLTKGLTQTIVPTITPANYNVSDLKWESSDKTVASVNKDGVVTGIKAGTATITLTDSKSSVAGSVTVTVTEPTVETKYPVPSEYLGSGYDEGMGVVYITITETSCTLDDEYDYTSVEFTFTGDKCDYESYGMDDGYLFEDADGNVIAVCNSASYLCVYFVDCDPEEILGESVGWAMTDHHGYELALEFDLDYFE